MRIVIIGAGQGGVSTADYLRREGFKGSIQLAGEEADLPYQRPPLSKQALSGEKSPDNIVIRGIDYYEKHNIDLRLGLRAERIDRNAKKVAFADGTILPYDYLVLATGARPRTIGLPGGDLPGILDLRTLSDLRALLPALEERRRIVVIGGGFIGLEIAAFARKRGHAVTVIEAEERIMTRVFPVFMSEWFTKLHRGHGVEILCNTRISAFDGDGAVDTVVCGDQRIPADLVILGIGVTPNQELAEACGLSCDDGILVDYACRTSDPHIYAVGDCTRHESVIYGRNVRLESVQNAIAQARVAAQSILGKDIRYDELPWFWSDQFDVKLQMVGLSLNHDASVVRGDPESGKFTVLYVRDGAVIAADVVNNPQEFVQCRKHLAPTRTVDVKRLQDTQMRLGDILAGV